MSKVGNIFAIEQLLTNADLLLETKTITPRLVSLAKNVQNHLLEDLLPDCLVLAEAFVWNEKNY